MLCFVYKSTHKEGMYLYIKQRDNFSDVPESLLHLFGRPIFVMVMNMAGRQLARVDIETVKTALEQEGFFLQLPPPPINYLEEYQSQKSQSKNRDKD